MCLKLAKHGLGFDSTSLEAAQTAGPKSHLNEWNLSNCRRLSKKTQPEGLPCSSSAFTEWVKIKLHRNCTNSWAQEEVPSLSNTSTPSVSLITNPLLLIHLRSRYVELHIKSITTVTSDLFLPRLLASRLPVSACACEDSSSYQRATFHDIGHLDTDCSYFTHMQEQITRAVFPAHS